MKSTGHFFSPAERAEARRLAEISLLNPFVPKRGKLEAEAIGAPDWREEDVWSLAFDTAHNRSHVTEELLKRLTALVETARRRFTASTSASEADLETYAHAARFYLYLRFQRDLHGVANQPLEEEESKPRRIGFWKPFFNEAGRCLSLPGRPEFGEAEAGHLLAVLFQIRRAFVHIYKHIVGRSPVASRLRAAIWESIFTHDLARYTASRHERMGDITTLITGPSGSGKELVARAIGLSRYIPFDPRAQAFTGNFAGSFHALNLSALSSTLIESELFGHKRGAFTGALADHAGWLERCPAHGTVFLDEIGELDVAVQVKLLRILQTRLFHRVGDPAPRRFRGKIIAATNRDLDAAIAAHRFRADLYYRLCADILETPSLHEQLSGSLGDLALWIEYIARQMGETEPAPLVEEVLAWVEKNLGKDYAWPGNFRELEQCVRNIWIRKSYRPVSRAARGTQGQAKDTDWLDAARAGTLSAEELLRAYCARVYSLTGNYRAAARKLGLDWRTVRLHVTRALEPEAEASQK